MNLPISTTLMVAVLTALRVLCFIVAVLFLMLALRAQFDADVMISWGAATGAALLFGVAGSACGWLRKVLLARRNAE